MRTPNPISRALMDLQRRVAAVNRAADVVAADVLRHWHDTIDRKLLMRLEADFPLIVAICGGGSSGKSTLLNSRFEQILSPAGGQAGLNRRVLAVIPPRVAQDADLKARLEEIMGAGLSPLTDPEQLTQSGDPLFISLKGTDANLILLDTPDFDTGGGDDYANREAAAQAMAAADLLIYIFTNATYNHRDNTDFVAAKLTELGLRDCLLVYRVYPSFSDSEVLDHAATVGRHIYGTKAPEHVRGVFRVDEDNRVAAGTQWMTPVQVDGEGALLWDVLGQLPVSTVRRKLLTSVVTDVVDWARGFEQQAQSKLSELDQYLAALTQTLLQSVRDAVQQFPMAEVTARFAQLWAQTDPAWMRAMRATGRLLDKPVRWLTRKVWQTGPQLRDALPAAQPLAKEITADLVQAANQLRRMALEPALAPVDPTHPKMVALPIYMKDMQARLQKRAWQPVLDALTKNPELTAVATPAMDAALLELVGEFRARMGLWDKMRQSLSAFLNVLPATAAVTYILATADPVGAAGIKIKLTGLLGLHDLYALVALPATSGMKAADQQQLQHLLAPLAEIWLGRRTALIEALLREHIVGELLDYGHTLKQEAVSEQDRLRQILDTLTREMDHDFQI